MILPTPHPRTHLPTLSKNRHHNLTPTVPIACNMSWKLPYIFDPYYPLLSGSGAAYATADGDALACGAAVERTKNESWGLGARKEGVEAGPVHTVGGCGEGVVEVEEEGGGVG